MTSAMFACMSHLWLALLVILTLLCGKAFGADAREAPTVVGIGDAELRHFVNTRGSKLKGDQYSKELERVTSKVTLDWVPTLRAILQRPVPPPSTPTTDTRSNELFWHHVAARLLGRLQDRESVELVLLQEYFDLASVAAFGASGTERVFLAVADPNDPLRHKLNVPPRVYQRNFDDVLAVSGSEVLRDALLEYAQTLVNGCDLLNTITSLPKNANAVVFVKQAHLGALASDSRCFRQGALYWGDQDLMRWIHRQYLGFRESDGFVDSGRLLARVGTAEEVQQVQQELALFLVQRHKDELEAWRVLAAQCKRDSGCYLEQYLSASKNEAGMPQVARAARIDKASAMITVLPDTKAKEELTELTVKGGRFPPAALLGPLLAGVSSEFVQKHIQLKDIIGLLLRTRTELHSAPDSWKQLLKKLSPGHPQASRFSAPIPPGSCELRHVNWKQATFLDAYGKTFTVQTTGGATQLAGVEFGDMNGDGAPEAIVSISRAGSPGAAGIGGMGTEEVYVFTVDKCTARFAGSLTDGSAKLDGSQLVQIKLDVVRRTFTLQANRLVLQEADERTVPPSKVCSNACSYNSNCIALSTTSSFGNCCMSTGPNGEDDPDEGARCRWLRGY